MSPPPDPATPVKALEESEQRLRALVNATTDIVYRMSPDWTEMRALDGRGFIVDTPSPRRNWIDDYIAPEDRPEVYAAIDRAIQGKTMFELEHRVTRVDGSTGWTLSRAVPITDEHGEIIEWFGAASDVSARHEAQEELVRVTTEAERQKHFYESLISSTPDLVYAFDKNYRFMFANQALLTMWNRSSEDSVGRGLLEVGYEPWHAEMHEREIDQVVATRSGIRGDVGFPHAELGWRTYDYIFTPVFDGEGNVDFIAGTTRDITDIKRTEAHLQLLINELNHRVKNTLATVQSIAAQSFKGGMADPEARAAFEARIMALSDAHTILTESNWESVSLRDVAERTLAAFRDGRLGPDRLRLGGPDIELRPQAALALAMALHELASNAVKFGALSNGDGRIDLSWSDDGRETIIAWRESGGPEVVTPQRRGFGSRLIDGLARELRGTVSLDYPRDGIVCTITIPRAQKKDEA